jgi:PIN domain nuclease of toxin-antitoxin system
VTRPRFSGSSSTEQLDAVLDTAPLVYYVSGRTDRLGASATRLLRATERAGHRVGATTISLFEIAQLQERGRIELSLPFDRWCQLVEDSSGIILLPLERAHVSEARALPALRDPFDRLIAGTAAALGVPLITSDDRITTSRRLRVVW